MKLTGKARRKRYPLTMLYLDTLGQVFVKYWWAVRCEDGMRKLMHRIPSIWE